MRKTYTTVSIWHRHFIQLHFLLEIGDCFIQKFVTTEKSPITIVLHECVSLGIKSFGFRHFCARAAICATSEQWTHLLQIYIHTYTHTAPVWLPMKREKANIIPTKAVNTVARQCIYSVRFMTVILHTVYYSLGEGESAP